MSTALLAVLALCGALGLLYLAARFGYLLGTEDAERRAREEQAQRDVMAQRRVVAIREARELFRKGQES